MDESGATVLIVDDEKEICTILSRLMKREGLRHLAAHDGKAALKMVTSEMPDVLLVDFKMPGMNGMELLKQAKEVDPDLPVIMITAYADVAGAVEAMRAGAHDYLAKPFQHHEVIRVVHRALSERKLKRKLSQLSNQLQESGSLREMMGPSDAIGQLIADVNRVARSEFTVVILGETGSGKELVARAIHRASARSAGPMVPVDCGAIPETLLESELFGHEKGAFTGASGQKPGKFEAAEGGTLFLDEISNMPIGSQAKLLRALQEKKVYRVGGTGVKVEPFGNIKKDEESGRTVVKEIREPVVDLFEEEDHTLVVAEMPGIGVDDVKLEVEDDLLTIQAERGQKKYRKEVLLPQSYPRDKMQVSCNNGIVEIRCSR